ncbi:MAG: type IV toxin-antitoxin system AbiEi family antitoxin domain-containing protein [Anaerolineae bacterium]
MDFERLMEIVGDQPVFETSLLLAGDVDRANVQRQLSRWTKSGRLYQLRRGLYALAPPFQKVKPHPFVVANRMLQPSYVSLQSALAYYGLIPEVVPVTTSVTTLRPSRWDTPLGSYAFRHVKNELFQDYRLLEVADEQEAFVASPEKALLDLIYLEPRADSHTYLKELRLQNLEVLDLDRLQDQAELASSPKLQRAAARVAALARSEMTEYERL